jgi:membrane protein insertase Oxa1/YidC/SpoIIIJ
VLLTFVVAAPGGLNLYWFASNLCSIAQQVLTMRWLRAREAHAKERRR